MIILTLCIFTITMGCFYITKKVLKKYFYWQVQRKSIANLLKDIPMQDLYQCSLFSQLAYCEPQTFFKEINTTDIVNNTNEELYFDPDKKITLFKQNLTTRGIFIDAQECAANINSSEDTQLYLFDKNNILYVVFRGTSSIFDLKTDLNIFITSNEWIHVHQGFFNQYNAVSTLLCQEIINWCRPINTVIFTGHSLGGALALLAAYDLCSLLPRNYKIKCYTYGAPRLGNQTFINELEQKNIEIWRVCNIKDVVPLLPLSFRFTHCNKNSLYLSAALNRREIYFTTNEFSNGFEFNHYWYLRPFGFLFASKWYYPLSAHSSQLYVQMLKTICKSNNIIVF